jgi:protein SCO1/2
MFKNKIYWLLLLLAGICAAAYFYSNKKKQPIRTLPYFEPKNLKRTKIEKHHSVPAFSFINQNGQTVTEDTVENKVYVCDFFFTTCQSICPKMSDQLERVYKEFKTKDDFLILSHTVNPETDSVPQLKEYAKKHGVTDLRWLFLTGDKKQLYEIARKGYLLNAEEGDGGEDDFIHTQNFALIDKERCIRGFYDGTDSAEVIRLIKDIHLLFEEYAYKENN